MDDIRLPMTQGSMEDITQEGESSQVPSSDLGVDSMSSQGARAIYEKEANIVIDYDQLSDDYRDVSITVLSNLSFPTTTSILKSNPLIDLLLFLDSWKRTTKCGKHKTSLTNKYPTCRPQYSG